MFKWQPLHYHNPHLDVTAIGLDMKCCVCVFANCTVFSTLFTMLKITFTFTYICTSSFPCVLCESVNDVIFCV